MNCQDILVNFRNFVNFVKKKGVFLVTFYSTFIELCNEANKTPSKVAMEIGVSKSAVTRWKCGSLPSDATLQKIAKYFNISISELIGIETNSLYNKPFTCSICGMEYNAYDEESILEHSEHHIKFTLAKKKFHYCYPYVVEEEMKAKGRIVINDAHKHTDCELHEAFHNIYKALFSRSLSACDYNLNHVDYDKYVSMLLSHTNQKKSVLNKLPYEMQQSILNHYGQTPGVIPEGQTYYNVNINYTNNDSHPNENILRIAGRDGRQIEKRLTDEQVKALEAIINQLPDAPDDL